MLIIYKTPAYLLEYATAAIRKLGYKPNTRAEYGLKLKIPCIKKGTPKFALLIADSESKNYRSIVLPGDFEEVVITSSKSFKYVTKIRELIY